MNRWNTADWLEKEARNRALACVYCGIAFGSVAGTRKVMATWEHIINDARMITRENSALSRLSGTKAFGCGLKLGGVGHALQTWGPFGELENKVENTFS